MFIEMHTVIPQGSVGTAEVVHDRPSRLEIIRSAWKGMHTEDRIHTRLLVNGRLVMTDAAFEKRTNGEVVREAGGDVLIAGLGIGLILVPILAKDAVQRVTVVEKSQDVISLIGPRLQHAKLDIVQGDILTWRPAKIAKFDVIYFDIWPDLCADNLAEMSQLHRAFRKHLKQGGWMGSWARDYLRSHR